MNRIRKISFHAICRPLRTTFSTALGKKNVMRSVIVKVQLDCGHVGVGEVPTSFVLKFETVERISEILREIFPEFLGQPIENYEAQIPILRDRYPNNPMTISGLEIALFRAYLSSKGVNERARWGGKSKQIETDITIPFLPHVENLMAWLEYAVGLGFKTYKLKTSGNLAADRRIVRHVHQYLEDHVGSFALRIDGNQGYTPDRFLKFADDLGKFKKPIQLIEQPLPKTDFDGMAHVKERSPLPIVLDETVFRPADLRRVIDHGLADGINIKFAKSGVHESRQMMDMARRANLKLMIGCMTETMVGLSAGILCAAGSGCFEYIDLDGVYFLKRRDRFGPIQIDSPRYTIL